MDGQWKQSHVYFHGYQPAIRRTGSFDQYQFTRPELARILQNWDEVADWRVMSPMKSSRNQGFHPTAIRRLALSAPIREFLARDRGSATERRVLYHGIGRDEIGGQALARGGRDRVESYDPYHPNPHVRALPQGPFDEVHSHYTLNVVEPGAGRQIVQELHNWLKDGGLAVITVRRDLVPTPQIRPERRRRSPSGSRSKGK